MPFSPTIRFPQSNVPARPAGPPPAPIERDAALCTPDGQTRSVGAHDGVDEEMSLPATLDRAPLASVTTRGRQLLSDARGSGPSAAVVADGTSMALSVASEGASSWAAIRTGGALAEWQLTGALAGEASSGGMKCAATLANAEFALAGGALAATVVGVFASLGDAHLGALRANVEAGAANGYATGVAIELLGASPSNYRDPAWGESRERRGKTQAFNGAMRAGMEAVRAMSPENRETLFRTLLADVREQVPVSSDSVMELARAMKRNL